MLSKTTTKSSSKSPSTNSAFKVSTNTRAIWITPFATMTGRVKIRDLTPYHLPFGQGDDEDFKTAKDQAALIEGSSDAAPPAWTFRRTGFFKDIVIYEGDPPTDKTQGIVAVLAPARWEWGISILTFPETSTEKKETYPSHDITLRRDSNPSKRIEAFVSDSVPYMFRWDNIWTGKCFSLYKVINGVEIQIGRYSGQYPWVRCGGLFLIEESEVDVALAVFGCVSTLRKDLLKRK